MKQEPAEEQFLKDVAGHKMRIHRDDGLYRHLEFRGPQGWHHWFEVVTWPNGLIIRGDMGNWAFSRIEDMFSFFRGQRINPGYWQEKLLAGRNDADTWEYWASPNVKLCGSETLAMLRQVGWPEHATCVLCGRTPTAGLDWWDLDGKSGPCCSFRNPGGCQQKGVR